VKILIKYIEKRIYNIYISKFIYLFIYTYIYIFLRRMDLHEVGCGYMDWIGLHNSA